MRLFGALEAGGTKMVCAIASPDGDILERTVLPTRSPRETMPEILDFFDGKGLAAIGVGCFGPVCVDRLSPAYGTILSSPKLDWQGFSMVQYFKNALGLPIGFDTDVNAAALGEHIWGCTKDIQNSVYITVGTGVGTGILLDGRPYHGMLHPEGGHIPVARHPDDPLPQSRCPYHAGCLEGLASGPAIEARWGAKGEALAENADVWRLEAYYLGQAVAAYILMLSPERIVLGGGVMHQPGLLKLVRGAVRECINGYLLAAALDDLDQYIVPPSLEDRQGILGALRLAMDAYFAQGGKL